MKTLGKITLISLIICILFGATGVITLLLSGSSISSVSDLELRRNFTLNSLGSYISCGFVSANDIAVNTVYSIFHAEQFTCRESFNLSPSGGSFQTKELTANRSTFEPINAIVDASNVSGSVYVYMTQGDLKLSMKEICGNIDISSNEKGNVSLFVPRDAQFNLVKTYQADSFTSDFATAVELYKTSNPEYDIDISMTDGGALTLSYNN